MDILAAGFFFLCFTIIGMFLFIFSLIFSNVAFLIMAFASEAAGIVIIYYFQKKNKSRKPDEKSDIKVGFETYEAE